MGREEIVFAAFFHSIYSQVHGQGKLGVKLSFTTCKEMKKYPGEMASPVIEAYARGEDLGSTQ